MKIQEFSNNQDLEEGLGRYLKYIGSKVGSLFSQRLKGKAQLLKASNKVLNMFKQAMGRRNETFKNVTWGSLENFLSNPSLLGLSQNKVVKLINNSKIKNQIQTDWEKISDGMVPPDDAWAVKDQPIGGQSNDRSAAKLAEIAVTYIIELAVIEYLENRTNQTQDTTSRSREEPAVDSNIQRRERYKAVAQPEPDTDTDADTEPKTPPAASTKEKTSKSPWSVTAPPAGKSKIPSSPQFDLTPIQSKIGSLSKDKLQKIRKIITDKLGATP
jgi:hypothetical protein